MVEILCIMAAQQGGHLGAIEGNEHLWSSFHMPGTYHSLSLQQPCEVAPLSLFYRSENSNLLGVIGPVTGPGQNVNPLLGSRAQAPRPGLCSPSAGPVFSVSSVAPSPALGVSM